MSERDKHIDEIQRLLQAGQASAEPRRPRAKQVSAETETGEFVVDANALKAEEIRARLEEGARAIVDNFEEELASLKPEAAEKIDEIIKPWWVQLQESGLLEQLVSFRDGKLTQTLSLNDPIEYFRPASLYGELHKGDKPFLPHAKAVLTRRFEGTTHAPRDSGRLVNPEEGTIDQLERFASEQWTSKLYLPQTRYLGFSGLDISSWPSQDLQYSYRFYRGMYGGWKRVNEPTHERRERTRLNLGGSEAVLPTVHPIVPIQFSRQIETGRVWERIEAALEGKK